MSHQTNLEKRLEQVKVWYVIHCPEYDNVEMISFDDFEELHAILYHIEYKEIEQ